MDINFNKLELLLFSFYYLDSYFITLLILNFNLLIPNIYYLATFLIIYIRYLNWERS